MGGDGRERPSWSNWSRPAKLRRIRTGTTKRERAQIEIVDGPPILGKIMRDPDSNARHVIDAVKTLDTLASNGAEAAAAGARFEITINLGPTWTASR